MARTHLSEAEGYELLKNAGVPVPRFTVVHSSEEVRPAAEAIGYPLVMKVISPQILHKSDAGGVVTGILSKDAAVAAYASIRSSVTGFDPRAVITGIILEEQLPPGLELIIGGKTDPSFGKVITLGMGGKLVELLNDISIRVLPLEDEEIQEMIRELRGYRLIRGFRGEVAKDEEALLHLVRAVAGMFREDPRIEEFDINPVILYGRGGCAVDARIYRADTPAQGETTAPVTMAGDLLDIHSIAVVGASQDPNKVGYAICRNLLAFPGDLYPVNPKGGMILGRKAYPTLASIPGKVDAVVITIPAYGVPQIVGETGEKGIPLAIIISSGFREIGEAGRLIEEDVLAIARRYGVRIMGPNCLGVMLPLRGST